MSYADSASATFANMLGTLDHLLGKAQEAGMAGGALSAKLVEDMFPLEMQFRVALNQILLAISEVGSKTIPLEETEYHSLAQIRERITVVLLHLKQSDPKLWAKADAQVDLTLPDRTRFMMTSEEYIRDWIMPNLYFHVAMVYMLLRASGLHIGKMDFLPHMADYMAQGIDE